MSNAFIAFMCHAPLTDYNYLEETLQEYNIQQYLIGYEASPYEHYHFLVQMSTSDYHLFAERVFRKKYKLRGRAIQDKPRQYGKIKNIEDLEKLKSYTIKDGNYRSNMPQQDVQKYFENSFKKADKQKLIQQVAEAIEEIEQEYIPYVPSASWESEGAYIRTQLKYIKLLIINYLRINTDINMCRSNINSYTQYYLKTTKHLEEKDKSLYLYHLLF